MDDVLYNADKSQVHTLQRVERLRRRWLRVEYQESLALSLDRYPPLKPISHRAPRIESLLFQVRSPREGSLKGGSARLLQAHSLR
ncbi:hypothetical protein D1872_249650 [compost metagenome]